MLAPSDFSMLKNFIRKPVHENRLKFLQWFKITSNQLTVNDIICDVVFVNNTANSLLMNFHCPVETSSSSSKKTCQHTARATQNWFQTNCPDFTAKDKWPPNSPDLNPLDYHVWGQCRRPITSAIRNRKWSPNSRKSWRWSWTAYLRDQ